jgi:hypothetical protein
MISAHVIFVTRVRIEIRIFSFLIGNPNSAKLTAQSAIKQTVPGSWRSEGSWGQALLLAK